MGRNMTDCINECLVKMNLPERPGVEAKQVAMHVVLQTIAGNKKIEVLTGHYKSGDEPDDLAVKPLHMEAITKKLQELRETGNAVIFSADLNTDRATAAYKMFAKENVVDEGNSEKTAFLKSAYNLQKLHEEERCTASKHRRGGDQPDKCKEVHQTIDFIFTNKKLKAVATLSVPTYKEVTKDSELLLPCWK